MNTVHILFTGKYIGNKKVKKASLEFCKIDNELEIYFRGTEFFQCFPLKPITPKSSADKQHKDAE